MRERRNGRRRTVDMPVTKQYGDGERDTFVSDLSPSGVKLRRFTVPSSEQAVCNLELHLAPGSISTVLAARRVWQDDDYEAFEFVSPSFAQQMFLERMVGNM